MLIYLCSERVPSYLFLYQLRPLLQAPIALQWLLRKCQDRGHWIRWELDCSVTADSRRARCHQASAFCSFCKSLPVSVCSAELVHLRRSSDLSVFILHHQQQSSTVFVDELFVGNDQRYRILIFYGSFCICLLVNFSSNSNHIPPPGAVRTVLSL